ncbi:MAG: VOC family protein [Acidaminococcaceae bacterium]|nr:VOC family protein [Acidaminococcaceae bacterium]
MNRISIICLGVRDMAQSIRFYRDGLGFETDEKEDSPKVVFFNITGTKFELYPLELLAEDINEKNPPHVAAGFAGITLAYNVKSEAEVHAVMDLAEKAGATIAKEPQRVFGVGIVDISPIRTDIIGKLPIILFGTSTKRIC